MVTAKSLSSARLQEEASLGSRFVHYPYTISLIFVTLRRESPVFLVKAGNSKRSGAWVYILASILLGWWGIPFGPRDTIRAIHKCWKGGEDVTDELMSTVAGHILFQESQQTSKATA